MPWAGRTHSRGLFSIARSPKESASIVLGQSYYPKWHGTLDDLKANLTDLAGRYPQNIIVVEYSVPNVRKINDIVHGLPGGKGLGTFIWEPTRWEGPALFDSEGNTKPEIEAYEKMAKDYGLGAGSRSLLPRGTDMLRRWQELEVAPWDSAQSSFPAERTYLPIGLVSRALTLKLSRWDR